MTNEEYYTMRKAWQEKMLKERDRIKGLFQRRGIPEYDRTHDSFDRIVEIENVVDCIYESTYFKIPEDINLKKVVQWFVHDTEYKSCTVFLSGWNPTTIGCDYDIEYYFKYAPKAHEKYLAEKGETK